jgi:drug/metabolite transporter (DMT)-like permease
MPGQSACRARYSVVTLVLIGNRGSSPDGRAVTAAVAGAACISTSAVVMRLAGSSASMTALGRSGFALPVLGLLAGLERRHGAAAMTARSRWLARLSGVFLAADLILWSHAITDIGAGLSTVIDNFQVVLVPLAAWAVLGERPHRRLMIALPVMVAGLVLVGGLAGTGGYGAHPALGVAFGIGVAVLYAVYILMLRQATGPGVLAGRAGRVPVAAPLFEATVGTAVGSLALGLALRDFRLGPAWPALGWLVLLAMTSQVIGWLLITMSMPKLPAWLVSALLLVQPVGSLILGAVILGERPSALQLAGVVVMLSGVLIAASGRPGGHKSRDSDLRATAPLSLTPARVAGAGPVRGDTRTCTPLHFQSIAHPRACRKPRVMAHNRWPGQGNLYWS